MEQNKEYRNRPTYIWPTDFRQRNLGKLMEKGKFFKQMVLEQWVNTVAVRQGMNLIPYLTAEKKLIQGDHSKHKSQSHKSVEENTESLATLGQANISQRRHKKH